MKKFSLWQDIVIKDIEDSLCEDKVCDVLIIGGGMAGMSTAFELRNSGKNIILIDSNICGMGISSKSTGKLTYLQELTYHKLEKIFDFNTAKLYLESGKEAINIARRNIIENKIDCNFETVSSYTFSSDKNIDDFKAEEDFFNRANIPFSVMKKLPIKFPSFYAIRVDDTAVFHPVKYIQGLKKVIKDGGNIKIYENTKAETLEFKDGEYLVKTKHANIKAHTVIVCTHYPFFVKPGFIPFRTHIEKDFICCSQVKQTHNFSAITNARPIHSIRYHEDKEKYIIYCNHSVKTDTYLNDYKNGETIENNFINYFHHKPLYIWSNHDIITNDTLPFIGRLKKDNDRLLIATGFNTWGMTNGIIAGKILADIVLKKENAYENIFDPTRSINLEMVKNFFVDSIQNANSFIKTKVNRQKEFYPDNVKVVTENGISVGIYTDESGLEHRVRNLCPHLKCSLIFNYLEKTWDCPCHGSRFDIDGNIINGPSVYNIDLEKR